jgi:hypothetical protein
MHEFLTGLSVLPAESGLPGASPKSLTAGAIMPRSREAAFPEIDYDKVEMSMTDAIICTSPRLTRRKQGPPPSLGIPLN